MYTSLSPAEVAADYVYALEVMEESGHLGLDDKHARLLHGILQRRIDEAREAFSAKPAAKPAKKIVHPFPLPIESEQTL